MRDAVRRLAQAAKGFLTLAEGLALYELAREAAVAAPCLEIGSYCGKSALFLGEGCRVAGNHPLFTVDHHGGSVEQQPGQAFFDPELFDPDALLVDTLPCLMANLRRAGLRDWVIPVVASSAQVARYWGNTPLGLVFIDAGHALEDVVADYAGWAPKVQPGGYLCFHDLFPDPADGGQAPLTVYQRALAGGGWTEVRRVDSLGVLQRS